MNILLGDDVILDILLKRKPFYQDAASLLDMCANKSTRVWVSASSMDHCGKTALARASEQSVTIAEIVDALRSLLKQVKILTVTGSSVRRWFSSMEDMEVMEDPVSAVPVSNFRRVCRDGIVISRGKKSAGDVPLLSPREFMDAAVEEYARTTIPLLDLQREHQVIQEELDDAVLSAMSEASYILGPQVGQLEKEIANYLGVKYCIGVASGTDALVLSLRALAFQLKGEEYFSSSDEIITTPFTFTATGDAILRSGATPVFVDINRDSYNIEPGQIARAVNKNTVGIIPVHLYGNPCDMARIMEIAEKHHLFVLEDVAQALGAHWLAKKTGSIGSMGALSFFPSKNLGGVGDGGMVSTDCEELAQLVRKLLKHGGEDKYNVEIIGYNSRLDTLQAAVLLAKLKHFDHFNRLRRELASRYANCLKGAGSLVLPRENAEGYHVYHQYTVRVCSGDRDEIQGKLKQNGIPSAVYYPVPLHKMRVFHGRSKVSGSLEQAERAAAEVLSLPMEPLMTDAEWAYLAKCIDNI